MTIAQCLAIAANICIQQSAQIELTHGGLWSGAHITLSDTIIISENYSDNLITAERSLMHKVCVSENCVYYYKYCEKQEKISKCTIFYNELSWKYNKTIIIELPSFDIMNSEISTIKLVLSNNQAIAFDNFSKISAHIVPRIYKPRKERKTLKK